MYEVFELPGVPNYGVPNEHEANMVAALLPWWLTKGISHFDRTILEDLWETPLDAEIPIESLRCMPEWCVYVELPQDFEPARFAFPDGEDYAVRGFFAHLDFARRRPEGSWPEDLLLLADLEKLDGTPDTTATNVRLPLSGRTVRGCLRAVEEGAKPREKERAEASGAVRFAETFARPFVTLLLHICEKNSGVVPADGSEALRETRRSCRARKRAGRGRWQSRSP